MIPGLRTSMMTRCRWCGREPEFASGQGELEKFCPQCEALQEPVLALRNPKTGVTLSFFWNPDDSLFFEFGKIEGETTRYHLTPEKLRASGVVHKFNANPNGKK